MTLEMQLTANRLQAMRASGLWPDRLLTDHFDDAVARSPEAIAIAAQGAESGILTRLSYANLKLKVDRIALGLASLGVGKGDVVSFQLPNWWHFVAMYLACVRIGAVANPLMPIFRERELRFMLNFAGSGIVVAAARFRDFDYGEMYRALRAAVPSLRRILLVGGKGEESFEELLSDRAWEKETDAAALFRQRRPDPNEATQLMYTSGTSGEPKAVMHTPNTLLSSALKYIEWIGLEPRDVVLMASPLAHQTGFIYGMMVPIILRTKLVLLDVWSAGAAARLIGEEGASFTMASTPFLADLTNSPDVTPELVRSLRIFVCAGAPIPSVLVQRATEKLRFSVLSCWGMTENGAVTIARPGDPLDKIIGTDGKAIDGMEVRVVDEQRRPVSSGTVGHLQARGMATFVGYLKRPELGATDQDGWFDTGDLARMDEDGYIRITGRSKDVIIRGGENIPVVEVENLLYRHPKIQDAAVVAIPDARLGERACAFVVTKAGETLNLPELTSFLASERMAKQYWPERLEVVEAMPRTPSGKIQKFRLREIAAKLVSSN